jgi:glycosyltransferase involved in cell wall biosynthesis
VRAVLKHYDRIIAVAELQARYLAEKEGVDPSRITVIRNGVDMAGYAPDGERIRRGQAHRAGLLNGGAGPLIGHVAALRPEKGHDVLFQAMGRLLQAHPGVRLAVVGDGPERPRLQALAGELGLGHVVRFVGARDDVADWLQAFDIVVLPSHPSVETLPLSLMEAMAAGRPVVASRVGSVEELVVDGVTGSLVPPGDVPSLSGALLRLVGDRRLREAYGLKGQERVKEFDIERTVEQTARLLRDGT